MTEALDHPPHLMHCALLGDPHRKEALNLTLGSDLTEGVSLDPDAHIPLLDRASILMFHPKIYHLTSRGTPAGAHSNITLFEPRPRTLDPAALLSCP